MATKPLEEAPPAETLKYQTWVFKVLIHCDGCTKRVKKILQGIEGVYTAEIDSQQHKVTVTGNVEAETIIKKLSRSGKSVELWPVQKPPPAAAAAEKKKDKKSGKSKGEKTEDNIVNNEKENQPIGEDCIDDDDNDGGEDCQENNECEGGACGNTGGENSKKKKKKKKKNKGGGGQNGNPVSAPPNNEGGKEISSNNTEKMGTSNSKEIISPPIQHAYPPPYPIPNMYYSPPQIPNPPPSQAPYGLSYNINTSYPISNASYYVGAPIMPMHAYTNSYNHLPPPPPPSDLINGRDYDDEYEGGGYCSIM